MAKIRGKYEPKKSKAFIVGNYFHTAFEGPTAHAAFIKENYDDIFTKNGKLRADFERADMMIEAAMADEKIKQLVDMPGENEKIMTGKLFGHYPWKIRVYEPQRTEYPQAIHMAIESLTYQNLSKPNNTCEVDLISRADAMGAVQDHFSADGFKGYYDGQKMMDRITALPSAKAKDIIAPKIKAECRIDEHGVLWVGHLWNPSYFVATVSENTEEQIRKYIQNQKRK